MASAAEMAIVPHRGGPTAASSDSIIVLMDTTSSDSGPPAGQSVSCVQPMHLTSVTKMVITALCQPFRLNIVDEQM